MKTKQFIILCAITVLGVVVNVTAICYKSDQVYHKVCDQMGWFIQRKNTREKIYF